ncbi:MAG TPA: D-tyrosyl-tRNA(Tyr) deacylase [Verrucomicrobiales bacterium]|nr:D-tyrosyl-tRNA(Tyr) deacylase [Verrucomicrobiales bacterium]HRJ09518.1 D-aminoacyl-tRNA deacylase [Prosthecobacter sp.]HRK15019.1 D-aminoacyl-tRNA deacylase [Prosthecobacter sp.]
MRVIIQRSLEASVSIGGEVAGNISHGLVILAGVEDADTEEDAEWLAGKIAAMRIFADEEGKMNRSVIEAGGGVLVVSQFTLHASTRKGNRPGFTRAARPEKAVPLYEHFLAALERQLGARVERGVFGADMRVALVNDGPVTIQMDSRARE